MKQLKFWNGRAQGRRKGTFYIAAYTQKQAAELASKAGGGYPCGVSEIRNYFSPCWGNSMNGINPGEPCVYYVERNEAPKRIL